MEFAVATSTQWTNTSGGSWTLSTNWSAGVPTSTTDAVLGTLSNFYTVTLTGGGAARSLMLGSMTLELFTSSGGTAPNLTVQGNVTNTGSLDVDVFSGNGGSVVS